jgi:maltose-binding protein MalE
MSGPTGWAVPKESPRKAHGYALARFITFGLEQQLDVARTLGMPALKEAAEKQFATLNEPKGAKRALLEPFEKGFTSLSERFAFPKWQEFAGTATETGAMLRNEVPP